MARGIVCWRDIRAPAMPARTPAPGRLPPLYTALYRAYTRLWITALPYRTPPASAARALRCAYTAAAHYRTTQHYRSAACPRPRMRIPRALARRSLHRNCRLLPSPARLRAPAGYLCAAHTRDFAVHAISASLWLLLPLDATLHHAHCGLLPLILPALPRHCFYAACTPFLHMVYLFLHLAPPACAGLDSYRSLSTLPTLLAVTHYARSACYWFCLQFCGSVRLFAVYLCL